jgi:hypothetical protein
MNIDIEAQITQMLADELTKSIDADIMKELFGKRNRRKTKIKNIFR